MTYAITFSFPSGETGVSIEEANTGKEAFAKLVAAFELNGHPWVACDLHSIIELESQEVIMGNGQIFEPWEIFHRKIWGG